MTEVLTREDESVPELSFQASVQRELVHKAAVEQVLVTDFAPIGDELFVCGGQAPRAHAYFSDSLSDFYDTLMLLESGRQAFVVASHSQMGVPRTSQFLFGDLEMTVRDVSALEVGVHPAELVWRTKVADPRRVRGELMSLRVGADLFVDGRRCLDIQGAGAFMNPRMYRLLRRRRTDEDALAPPPLEARIDAARVGRRDVTNVVVSEPVVLRPADDGRPRLATDVVVDQGHRSFFDHPLDHVPGMLLVESMRQTALLGAAHVHGVDTAQSLLRGCRVQYGRYAELDARACCRATVGELEDAGERREVDVDLELVQLGDSIATARMTMSFGG